jgi:hypothetical protein
VTTCADVVAAQHGQRAGAEDAPITTASTCIATRERRVAQVRRDGKEHHAHVAHAQGDQQELEEAVGEEPERAGRGDRANERHREHAADGQAFEEVAEAVQALKLTTRRALSRFATTAMVKRAARHIGRRDGAHGDHRGLRRQWRALLVHRGSASIDPRRPGTRPRPGSGQRTRRTRCRADSSNL